MLCFNSAETAYCVSIEATRAVRPAAGMVALPSSCPDIAGVIPGDPPLTVIAPLAHRGGTYIVVIHSGEKTFGLLVDAVSGLRRVDDSRVRSAPAGQLRQLISGIITDGDELILVTDPEALASRL
jgi:chemotaxis signal transduction protein